MKKNNKGELLRIQNVIETDRLNVGEGFNDLLLRDLEKLLFDFFDIDGQIDLEILKEKNKYRVQINFFTTRLKTFIDLSK